MNDYSDAYSDNKHGRIYLARNNNIVYFKPFLTGLSYDKELKDIEIKKLFFTQKLTDSAKETRKLSFNVVAVNHREAVENHKKFQTLARMLVPDEGGRSFVHVKFANLINDFKPLTKQSFTYLDIVRYGIKGFCTELKYKPEMDLGFFDLNGMFYAKAFTIDLDLKLESVANRKRTRQQIEASISKPTLSDSKYQPGNAFGFSVPFNKKPEE